MRPGDLPRLGRSLALPCAALACLLAAVLFADPIERGLLWNTARLVGIVELCTLPLAAVVAFLLARTNAAGRTVALVLCSSLLFVPLCLQLCGWEAAFGRQGWHTFAFTTLDKPWLWGWRGVAFIHVVYSLPWATCLMAAVFAHGNRQHEEAALLDGNAWQVFNQITVPQLTGGVLLASVWVLVITAGEMTVTNIYLVPTYAEEVYNSYAMKADVQAIVAYQMPLLLFVAALVLLLLSVLRPAALLGEQDPYQWTARRGQHIIGAGLIALFVALAAFPLGNLIERLGTEVRQVDGQVIRNWSMLKGLQVLAETPRKFALEFRSTAAIAISAMFLAIVLAAALAWLARRRPSVATLGWFIATIGIALPGPVIGLGVIAILNHDQPVLIYLYDRTLVGPILAILVRVFPLVFIALWWAFCTLDEEPLDAATLDGAGPWRQLFSIALPQRWPLLISAALATFAIASGDVSASLLVLPPGPRETIARRMFGLIHVGADDQVAGVALLCWLGYFLIAAIVMRLLWTDTSPAVD